MELRYRKEATVGLLVLSAAAIVVVGLTLLEGGGVGRGQIAITAQFADAGGVKPGDPVMVSGVQAGQVAAVELRGLEDVRVDMKVDQHWVPRSDAWARAVSVGFVGDHQIEYWPGTSGQPLPADAMVRGRSGGGFDELADQLGARADTVLSGAQALLSARLADDVHETLAAVRRALAALGDGPVVQQATATLAQLERTAARLDTTLANPGLVTALNNMDEVTESLNEMIQGFGGATVALQSILARVDSGEGTLGKLASDSLLYQDLRRATTALADLLTAVRQEPGRYLTVTVKIF